MNDVKQVDKERTAWALDLAPNSMTWEKLTASHVGPTRLWQANRVAQAFAAHRIAAEAAKDAEIADAYSKIGSLEELLRQANVTISDINSHLPKYQSTLNENKALQARVAELDGVGHEIISRAFTTYTARNGRKCGIQDESGEQCMIVPHEPFYVLEELLKEPTQ